MSSRQPGAAEPTPLELTRAVLTLPLLAEAWTEVRLEDGAPVFARGDPGDAFYTVVEGAVEVFAPEDGRPIVLERLGPGESFGELALLDGGQRAASVVCVGPTRLKVLRRDDFLDALPRSLELTRITFALLGTRMRRSVAYLEVLTTWARAVAEGRYDEANAAIEASGAGRADGNVRRFVTTFHEMVKAVEGREAALKRELNRLRIQVDRAQHAEQLSEITESDFFRDLEARTRRQRRAGPADAGAPPEGAAGPAPE